ncbi:glutaredoxin family protein [Congregibacter sp.]|uniref:glutaredoxin family protein n=1 Tax=Congregibacter sp. TaxID=2744308 RepID=UPI003F6B8276
MMKEVPLILYSTVGCHLCEEAEALLHGARQLQPKLQWRVVDIANDDVLFERYGWLIPVLYASSDDTVSDNAEGDAGRSGRELRWPFDAQKLQAFLRDAAIAP